MNLTKLFNFQYLKQNLKKSKGILTLISLVVPVITALVLISYNTNSYVSILYGLDLSFVNIIGMYVMPIILSSALYGYVYKRNSVDFINSMPMSRSTIYATNFLAGIIIILFSQVLTLIVNIVCSFTLANMFLPMAMILDMFVLMLVSYIFVFAVTALAMTVSGNLLTQIVVTMLIVFLIPFISVVGNEFSGYRNLNLDIGNNVLVLDEIVLPEFSTPFRIFTTILYGESRALYSSVSIGKMIVLSIVYFILGMYLFNKRKMENVEKSFSKTWIHLLVKGITLVPMIFIICAAELEDIPLVVAVTLTFIYYLVYDFITNKKVALKITIPIFIVSSLILVGVYEMVHYANEELLIKNISLEEIEKVAVEVELLSSNSTYRNEELDVEIEDEKLIKELCSNFISNEEQQIFYESRREYGDYPVNKHVKLKLKNGKEIYLQATVGYNAYKTIVDTLLYEEKYKKQYEEMIQFDEIAIIYDGKMLNKEATQKIRDTLNNLDLQTIMDTQDDIYMYGGSYSRGSGRPNIRFYEYKNHEFRVHYLDKALTPEIFEIVTTTLNEEAIKELTSEDVDLNKITVYMAGYSQNGNNENDYDNTHFASYKEIIDYILAHAQEVCDISKPYCNFSCYGNNLNRNLYIHVNVTEELTNLINKYRIIETEETQVKYVDEIVYQ